jgi:hypothetical protein
VPPDWLPTLRKVADDDQLLDVVGHLPDDIADRLLRIAAGRAGHPAASDPGHRAARDRGRRVVVVRHGLRLERRSPRSCASRSIAGSRSCTRRSARW